MSRSWSDTVNRDPARAITAWKRVVELSSADYGTLFSLGMLLWQSGRRDEARLH